MPFHPLHVHANNDATIVIIILFRSRAIAFHPLIIEMTGYRMTWFNLLDYRDYFTADFHALPHRVWNLHPLVGSQAKEYCLPDDPVLLAEGSGIGAALNKACV